LCHPQAIFCFARFGIRAPRLARRALNLANVHHRRLASHPTADQGFTPKLVKGLFHRKTLQPIANKAKINFQKLVCNSANLPYWY
jgi:hypothetical protein